MQSGHDAQKVDRRVSTSSSSRTHKFDGDEILRTFGLWTRARNRAAKATEMKSGSEVAWSRDGWRYAENTSERPLLLRGEASADDPGTHDLSNRLVWISYQKLKQGGRLTRAVTAMLSDVLWRRGAFPWQLPPPESSASQAAVPRRRSS